MYVCIINSIMMYLIFIGHSWQQCGITGGVGKDHLIVLPFHIINNSLTTCTCHNTIIMLIVFFWKLKLIDISHDSVTRSSSSFVAVGMEIKF